jgi:aarF domain-containing kinase
MTSDCPPHQVEPNFTTLVTAIVVLEGLGRQLDPTLDLFAVALPLLL